MILADDHFASITAAVKEGHSLQQHREGHPAHAADKRRLGPAAPPAAGPHAQQKGV